MAISSSSAIFRIFLSTILLAGCSTVELPETESIAQPGSADRKSYIDEDGNGIKPEGWLAIEPVFGQEIRTRSVSSLRSDGREVIVTHTTYRLEQPLIIAAPRFDLFSEASDDPAVSTMLTVSRDSSGQLFCYMIFLDIGDERLESSSPEVVRYCDANGDGVFETNVMGSFAVPIWVQ